MLGLKLNHVSETGPWWIWDELWHQLHVLKMGQQFLKRKRLYRWSHFFRNCMLQWSCLTLRWRHNGPDSVSNHQPHYCLLKRLFRRRSKETSKLHVTGLCAGNSPGTGEFPPQMAINAENVSIWLHHHGPVEEPCLTHWGQEKHICVRELVHHSDHWIR